jgi:hypothetical protein
MSLIEREMGGIWKETNIYPLKFVKFPNSKFHENLSGISRDIVCLSSERQTDIKRDSPRMPVQLKYNYATIPPPLLIISLRVARIRHLLQT